MALSAAAMREQELGRKSAARRYPFRAQMHTMCQGCCYASAVERHHVNGRARDNRPENVLLLCVACHKREHSGDRWRQDRAKRPARTLKPARKAR